MKTISAGLQTHLNGVTTTIATLWRVIRKDTTEFFFTDHDKDIIFDGDTYVARSGYTRTAIATDVSLAVDNLDIEGIFDSAEITETDIRAGKFDFAEIFVSIINWNNVADGVIKMRKGHFGEITLTKQGVFRTELRGLSQQLSQTIVELYQPECRADLGDSRCKVPIDPALRQNTFAYIIGDFIRVNTIGGIGQEIFENRIYECTVAGTSAGTPPTFDIVVDNTTIDGTATFTARQAWMRHAVVDTVTDNKTFTLTVAFDEVRAVDDYFNGGAVEFETGANDDIIIEIRDWVQSTRTLTVFIPTSFTVISGDKIRLYPGCNKRSQTCITKFVIPNSTDFANGNIKNFRGEPFIPGQDALTRYPDAK